MTVERHERGMRIEKKRECGRKCEPCGSVKCCPPKTCANLLPKYANDNTTDFYPPNVHYSIGLEDEDSCSVATVDQAAHRLLSTYKRVTRDMSHETQVLQFLHG